MNSLTPVYTEQTECQDCYKCIRRCPVKAIRVENGHAAVIGKLCIACGRCVINCPVHAKKFRNDTPFVKQLLQMKKKVYVSLAPSFTAEFTDFSTTDFLSALKHLGFAGVSETALGADFVSAAVSEMLVKAATGESDQKLFLSSACPAAVEFIKRYMGSYAPYITDCASPLLAHARYLRKLYGKDISVVFIGPCIAKKREADVWTEIDAALTYKELHEWFEAEGISAPPDPVFTSEKSKTVYSKEPEFVPHRAAKAELFPVDGGMIAACKKYDPIKNVQTMAVSGIEAIRETLKGLDVEKLEHPLFIELLSCTGGCVNGPGNFREQPTALRRSRTINFAKTAAEKLDDKILKNGPVMTDTLPGKPVEVKNYTEEQITGALHSVGKFVPSDEINCGGCGYETCREFAHAMLDGVAEKTMCVSYMRILAQKKANGLVRAIPSGVVIVDKNLLIIECNKNFAVLMGNDIKEMYDIKPGLEGADLATISQNSRFFMDVLAPGGPDVLDREVREGKKILHYTIFTIEKGEVVAGVLEDITAPQSHRKHTITQARKVIDKNLSVVQKIAFLLGENAAETESILNSIIDSFGGENDDA